VTVLAFSIALLSAPAVAQDGEGNTPSWATACSATSRLQPLTCAMEQRVILRETGQQLASVIIQTPAAGEATLVVRLPLGLSIADGVTFEVDEDEITRLDIQTCEANGCFIRTPLTDEILVALRRGSQLILALKNNLNSDIRIPISLSGFSAAFDSVK